jgi:hypothetical protein
MDDLRLQKIRITSSTSFDVSSLFEMGTKQVNIAYVKIESLQQDILNYQNEFKLKTIFFSEMDIYLSSLEKT